MFVRYLDAFSFVQLSTLPSVVHIYFRCATATWRLQCSCLLAVCYPSSPENHSQPKKELHWSRQAVSNRAQVFCRLQRRSIRGTRTPTYRKDFTNHDFWYPLMLGLGTRMWLTRKGPGKKKKQSVRSLCLCGLLGPQVA